MITTIHRALGALAVGISMLLPGTASAIELDYYTYNGFEQTVDAFQRLALIFNDNEYIYLIFIAVVLGIVFGAMTAGVRALGNGGNGNTLSWVWMVLVGVALFKAVVIPKGTIHIYDPVRNAFQPVAGVPDLVILVAGGMNKVERIVVELVDNGAAQPYGDLAGGINFQLLLSAMTDFSAGFDDAYLMKSIKRYYSDCSQMALVQPAYAFDLNQLRSGSNNLFTLLRELRSPTDMTEWYDIANKGGITVSCEAAWDDHLEPVFNNGALYDAMVGSVCTKSGFNTGDGVQKARCLALLSDLNFSVYNVQANYVHLLRNAGLSAAIAAALRDENPDVGLRALTNLSVMTEGLGVAQAANEWLPTIRATVSSIVLGLFPLLVVFLVTPLMPKSLLMMFGLVAWLTFWGISDAVMHRGAMDQAFQAVEEIRRHSMGLDAMLLTPEVSMKALAIFGKARSMGIMVATMLSAGLVGFSGYAFSQIAHGFQGRIDSAGGDAATRALTPEGQGQTLQGNAQAFSTAFNMGNMGYQNYAAATAFNRGTELSRADQYLAATSAQGVGMAAAMTGKGAIEAGSDFGGLLAHQGNVAKSGADPLATAALFSVANEVTNLEQAGRFGDARGKVEAMAASGFGNANDFNEWVSGIQTLNNAGDTRTHAANIESFKDIHAQRTGEHLSNAAAAAAYSRMRYSSITGDIRAFGGDADRAIDYMMNNRHLADHHLAGIIQGANRMGLDPGTLSEAAGSMQAAVQSANYSQLGEMAIGDIAMGGFANQVMATQSGLALQQVMESPGLIAGTASLTRNETLLRDANSQQLENLARVTQMPLETLAMAKAGAGQSIAFGQEQAGALEKAGVLSPEAAVLASGGGMATVSLEPSGSGITTSRVFAGDSVSVDDSTRVDAGAEFGGAKGAAMLLMNEASEDQLQKVLQATDGNEQARDALKMDMSSFIRGVQTSDVTLSQSESAEGHFGWDSGKWLGFHGGGSVAIQGGIADRTSYDVNYGAVDKVFRQSYATAKNEVRSIADERTAAGETVTADDREAILFDRFAHHLNQDMGGLVANLKENQAQAMKVAEDMEEVPTQDGKEANKLEPGEFEEALRKSRSTAGQPKL